MYVYIGYTPLYMSESSINNMEKPSKPFYWLLNGYSIT